MKKRNIEQKINQEFKSATPDILHKIDFESIEILEPTKPIYKRVFRPALFPAIATAVIALVAIIILNIGQTSPGTGVVAYSDREESYTLSALSAISLLNQIDDEATLDNSYSTIFLSQIFSNTGPTLLLDEYLEQLKRNLVIIEPLIGEKESIQFNTVASELEEYSYKVIFSNKDLRNQVIEYTMHYNEIEVDEDTYLLEGIMIINNIRYILEGEITFEENGFELEVIAHHPNEEETYVEILQEVSDSEHTLEYYVVKNDITLYESELSFEFDGDEITIEMAYESETVQYSFDIIRTAINNTPVYFIEYEIETLDNEEEGEITVEVVYNESENTYYYRYMIESDDDQAIRYTKRIGLLN